MDLGLERLQLLKVLGGEAVIRDGVQARSIVDEHGNDVSIVAQSVEHGVESRVVIAAILRERFE